MGEPGAGDEAGQEPQAPVPGDGGDGRHQQHQRHPGIRHRGEKREGRLQLTGQADKNVSVSNLQLPLKLTAFEGKE